MNQDNPFATGVSINQDIVYDISESRCVSVDVKATETLYDLRNTDLYANHPTLNRELLALGREEE